MSGPPDSSGLARGLDHVGIVGADLHALARDFTALGFALTPVAAHKSGRTANRCAMLRDGGYLELIAVVPGKASATLDRFLARGPGAHILALEVADEAAAEARLHRAGLTSIETAVAARDSVPGGDRARFAVVLPPDPPEGRVLMVRHLTRDLLWRPETTTHPNGAMALIEAVYAADAPAETMTRLSRLSGRPAEPDPLGGYRIPLGRGCLRILPRAAVRSLFPDSAGAPPLIGLTIATENERSGVAQAGGVALRFIPTAS